MNRTTTADDPQRWVQLTLLAGAVLCSMVLWFSATAVAPQLSREWKLDGGQTSWLTMSVQMGFVIGALSSAVLNLADRVPPNRLMFGCSLLGAFFNAAIALWVSDELARTGSGFLLVLTLRLLTGVMLAGVYPPGMKLVASWFRRGRGLAIGVLVGALTVGSASPHLLNAFPIASSGATEQNSWRLVLLGASASAVAAALLAIFSLKSGPLLAAAPKFDWRYGFRIWSDVAVRRANFGYLGHMWELYAMWSWTPVLLLESAERSGQDATSARFVCFAVVAIGGIGCVVAGLWADRLGRTAVTTVSLFVSGSCALLAGFLVDHPLLLTALCLLWGFAVVADSAQFSAAVSELCDPQFVGTALTIQTCAGFLLTMATIRLVPMLLDAGWGWGPTLATLALGPAFGAYHMLRLRWMPEATKMASGNR